MGYTPQILVVGGGITGTATARDLAIRGLDVTLLERGPIASGATGRMQGLLYSGARQPNPTAARRCFEENRALLETASHCVTETGGLLVAPGDGDVLQERRAVCREANIPAEELTGDEARSFENALGPDVERAVRVPDAVVDPIRLTVANARSAIQHGATVRPHTELTAIHVEDGAIEGVTVEHNPEPTGRSIGGEESSADERDSDVPGTTGNQSSGEDGSSGVPGKTGSSDVPGMPGTVGDDSPARPTASAEELDPDYVVNATGAWADRVAALADLELPLARSGGTTVVTDGRPIGTPISRCADGTRTRTIVPQGRHCLLGTRGEQVDDPDAVDAGRAAVDRLLGDLAALVPDAASVEPVRAVGGVQSRPPGAESGVGFAVVDHADHDDCWGMATVLGGTLTTSRLVAERVTDHLCGKFGITRPCRTGELSLPGDGDEVTVLPGSNRTATDRNTGDPEPIACESVPVGRSAITAAIQDDLVTPTDLTEISTRTGAATGACQGGRCAHRIAAELHPDYDPDTVADALDDFLEERWSGQRQVLWGNRLARAARDYRLHAATLNRKYTPDQNQDGSIDLGEFDDGPGPGGVDDGPPIARQRGMSR